MPADNTIGPVLAAYLASTGLSVAELARRAGLSHDAVSHYLAGDREPSLSAFRKLCRGLAVAPAAFIDRLPPLAVVKLTATRPRGRPKKVEKKRSTSR